MADLINFVSKTEIDAKKEQRRQARKTIISKAKDDFYREQRKKEQRKETGESSWMLPSLSKRIKDDADSNAQDKSDKKKCKKAKKQKKDKKEKKHKKSKQGVSQNGNSSESESEDEWVEKGTANAAINSSKHNLLQRDSWMLCPPITSELNQPVKGVEDNEGWLEEETEVEDETKKLSCMDQPGQHSRELNPYWKDGGTGLPSERDVVTVDAAVSKGTVSSFNSKWLEKAYQRAKDQAQEEGKSVDAVVAERWGSVERLESLIKEAQQRERTQDTAVSRVAGIGRYRDKYDMRENRRHRTEKRGERDERQRSHAVASSDAGHYGSFRQTSKERLKKMRIDGETRQRTDNEFKKFFNPSGCADSSSFAGKFMRPPSSASASTSSSWDFDSTVQSIRPPGVSAQGSKISGGWRKKTAASAELGVVPKGAETKEKAEVLRGVSASHGSESSSSCCESEDEEERGDAKGAVPTQKITEADLNEIGAKIVKAEIMRNEELAAKLKSQLDGMRKTKQLQEGRVKESQLRENTEEVVILTRTDAAGNVRPVEMMSTPEPKGGRRKRKKVETHSKEGKRERYFADDDRCDLKEMVRREKMRTTEDHNAMLARLSSKASTMANSDDFTLDDHFVSSAASKLSPAQLEERERQKAIKEHRHLAAQLAKCRFCFENPDIAKHLIIAIGIKVYLALPLHESLTQGHCLIVPMQHCSASTLVDEDVWSEIQIYKKGLTKMFEEMEEDVVFLETCKQLRKQHHMVIECIPLPKEAGEMAPIYFKKAIMESDTEWAQNKKLIDTRKKGLRASIPRGLPYFSVEFGLDGGFAHVIEEEELFPRYFGREIVGGMLDLEARRWRKPRRENFEEHKKKVLQFADWWKPFDWTRKLDRITN